MKVTHICVGVPPKQTLLAAGWVEKVGARLTITVLVALVTEQPETGVVTTQ
jgi:hypothetical protein